MEAFVFEGHFPFPGKCATCGTTKGKGIDLGVDYPEVMFSDETRRGAVLLCENCVASFGKKLGLLWEPVEIQRVILTYTQEQIDEIKDSIKDDMAALSDKLVTLLPESPTPEVSTSVEEAETSGLDSASGQSSSTSVEQDSDGVPSDSGGLFSELFDSGKSTKSRK